MDIALSSAPSGYRFPREGIAVAVHWYLRYGLSYRDVEELLAERGVNHVTIYRWVQTFTPEFLDAARRSRHAAGDRWFVDETYVKVAGRWIYLYRAIGQHGQVIDVQVSYAATDQRRGPSSPVRWRLAPHRLRSPPTAHRSTHGSSSNLPRARITLLSSTPTTRWKLTTGGSKLGFAPCEGSRRSVRLAGSQPATRSCKTSNAGTTNSVVNDSRHDRLPAAFAQLALCICPLRSRPGTSATRRPINATAPRAAVSDDSRRSAAPTQRGRSRHVIRPALMIVCEAWGQFEVWNIDFWETVVAPCPTLPWAR